MFRQTAEIYDAIYSFKDYRAEAEMVHEIAQERLCSGGNRLLDVACGTGKHLEHFRDWYSVEGLDLDPGLLEIARGRLPGVSLYEADMTNFQVGAPFDVVTCLFSAIGYATTPAALRGAIRSMAAALKPGGVLLVEPWFQPDEWHIGHLHMATVDLPNLKVARTNIGGREGDISVCDMHYLIGTPDGIEYRMEPHRLALYTHEEVGAAFREAGLSFEVRQPGPMGRGLFIGVKPE